MEDRLGAVGYRFLYSEYSEYHFRGIGSHSGYMYSRLPRSNNPGTPDVGGR